MATKFMRIFICLLFLSTALWADALNSTESHLGELAKVKASSDGYRTNLKAMRYINDRGESLPILLRGAEEESKKCSKKTAEEKKVCSSLAKKPCTKAKAPACEVKKLCADKKKCADMKGSKCEKKKSCVGKKACGSKKASACDSKKDCDPAQIKACEKKKSCETKKACRLSNKSNCEEKKSCVAKKDCKKVSLCKESNSQEASCTKGDAKAGACEKGECFPAKTWLKVKSWFKKG